MYTIYKYTNKTNGKVYIGQTSQTLEERAQHNGRNYKSCTRFYNAIQKYGWESFEPEILEVVYTQEESWEREAYYINLYMSFDEEYGYNMCKNTLEGPCESGRKIISEKAKERYSDPTNNPMYGKKHSEESKRKQSEIKRGKNNPMYGTHWNERQKALCGTKGKKLNLTDERRKELSDRLKEINLKRRMSVFCITDNLWFSCAQEAADYYSASLSSMYDVLSGRTKTCRGKEFIPA